MPDLLDSLPPAFELPTVLRALCRANLVHLPPALDCWYQLGPAWPGCDHASPWSRVTPVPGAEANHKSLLLRRAGSIARALDSGIGSAGPPIRPLLHVADPIAGVVTLSFHVAEETTEGDSALNRQVEGVIVHAAREWRRHDSASVSGLAYEPSLSLVFVGPRPAARVAEGAWAHLTGRAGLLLLDLQVRWFSDTARCPLLNKILCDHLPGDVWGSGPVVPATGSADELTAALEQFAENARRRLEQVRQAASLVGTFAAADAGQALRRSLPTLRLTRGGPAGDQAREDDATTFGVLNVSERRWAGTPLVLPLSVTTLVAGQNGSGKTSLVEVLATYSSLLARPRVQQPWLANARDASGARPGNQFAALRATPPLTVRAGAGANQRLHTSDVLALYADDADLWRGTKGETAIASIAAGRAGGLDALAEAMGRAVGAVAQFGEVVPASRRRVGEPGGHASGHDLLDCPRWIVRAARYYTQHELQEARDAEADPTQRAEWEAAGEALRGLKTTIPRAFLKSAGDLSGFCAWVGEPAPQGGGDTGWEELGALDLRLGGSTALGEAAAESCRRAFRECEEGLVRLADVLYDDISPESSELPERLDRFFSLRVVDDVEHKRGNTARLVREGQTARLGHFLVMSQLDWPFCILDEPTLGQDDASCARTTIRILRVARKGEARRWDAACRETGRPKRSDTAFIDMLPEAEEAPEAPGYGVNVPPPAQTMVVSYHQPALDAVADVEGTCLTGEVVRRLRQLLPPCWLEWCAAALRTCADSWTSKQSALPRVPAPLVPYLIEFTSPPPPVDQAWFGAAVEALEALQLDVLAADLRTVVNHEDLDAAARRLLTWLIGVGYLPALYSNSDLGFELSGVCNRELPSILPAHGAMTLTREIGPTRLRRVSAVQQILPEVHLDWRTPAMLIGNPAVSIPEFHPWRVSFPADATDSEALRLSIADAGLDGVGPDEPAQLVISRVGGRLRITTTASGRSIPSAVAVEDVLVEQRLHAVGVIDEDEPLVLAIVSDNAREVPAVPLHFRFHVPRLAGPIGWTASVERAARLRTRLCRVRDRIQWRPMPRHVALYPSCTLPAAFMAGRHLNETHGLSVRCEQNGALWRIEERGAEPSPLALTWEDGSDPVELLVVVSVSSDSGPAIRGWREASRSVAPLLHFMPKDGPSRSAIDAAAAPNRVRDTPLAPGAVVRAWAEQIGVEVAAKRPRHDALVRLFLNAPHALGVAIGQAMRQVSPIVVMEFLGASQTYTESMAIPLESRSEPAP